MEAIDLHLQKMRQDGDVELRDCPLISSGFRPIPPHKVGIAHLVLKPRFLLADPTGCGKTPQALAAFAFLKEKAPNIRLLVASPRSAVFQWGKSVQKFLVGVTPKVVGYSSSTGKGVSRAERLDTYENPQADVLLLSYHQMALDVDVILEHHGSLIVVFDEVQHLKSHRGEFLFPSAQKLSMKSRYVWGLSATPIMNRLDELYGIMEAIYPGFFGSFRRFEEAYHEITYERIVGRTVRRVSGYKNIPQLMVVMRPFYIRRPSSEIDKFLPEPVTKDVVVEMTLAQRKDYTRLVRQKLLESEQLGRRKVQNVLVYSQMCVDAPAVLGLDSPSAKYEELLRILTEEVFDEKVIIYSHFRKVVEWLSSQLTEAGIRHVSITGAVNTLERENNKVTFNESKDVNVILLTDAGGEALDLPSASVLIAYDLPWSWGKFNQLVGRARRIGSKFSKLLLVLLVTQNSIDQHVYDVVYAKEQLFDETFGLDTKTLELSPEVLGELFNKLREQVEK